jgi:hypothetical protein
MHRRDTMSTTTVYTAIDPKKGAFPEKTCFFMMNSLLYSRMENGFPSNDEYYDEDVNVYLANLLTSLVNPDYHRNLCKYISVYDINVFKWVEAAADTRTRFLIYKTNADYLLVSLGIFNNPRRKRPNSLSHTTLSRNTYIGRGKTYYNIAQAYALKTSRRNIALSEILGKLSFGFEKYMDVLTLMKGEYLNLVKRFSTGEMYHLERSIESNAGDKNLTELYDDFLDAYSRYKREKTPAAQEMLTGIANKIRALDRSFTFDID